MTVFEKADTMNYGTPVELDQYAQLAIVDSPINFEGFISDDDERPTRDDIVTVETAEKFLNGELNYRSNLILVGDCDGDMWVHLVANID